MAHRLLADAFSSRFQTLHGRGQRQLTMSEIPLKVERFSDSLMRAIVETQTERFVVGATCSHVHMFSLFLSVLRGPD